MIKYPDGQTVVMGDADFQTQFQEIYSKPTMRDLQQLQVSPSTGPALGQGFYPPPAPLPNFKPSTPLWTYVPEPPFNLEEITKVYETKTAPRTFRTAPYETFSNDEGEQ